MTGEINPEAMEMAHIPLPKPTHRPFHVKDVEMWSASQIGQFLETLSARDLSDLVHVFRTKGWLSEESTLTFKNISSWYPESGDSKIQTLSDVSGYVRPGMMVAVLGEGGTPLIQALGKRNNKNVTTGEIHVNGQAHDAEYHNRVSIISKEDIHHPTLTVRETVLFSMMNRMPEKEMPNRLKELMADAIIKILGLEHVSHQIVGGGLLRGISGGEKRRLSIACGLSSPSSIFVADKPTNGLDSSTAREFIQVAKQLSSVGQSFIMSLVQPSPDICALFDRVLVMSQGHPIYWGPPTKMVSYFENFGLTKPEEKSDPDFVEELIRSPEKFLNESKVDRSQESDLKTSLRSHFHESDEFKGIGEALRNHMSLDSLVMENPKNKQIKPSETTTPLTKSNSSNDFINGTVFLTSFFAQVILALKVQWTTSLRHFEVFWGSLGRVIFVGIMIGTAFFDLGESQDDARNGLGLLFYVLTYFTFIPTQLVPVFFEERAVFYKQRAEKYFHPASYFVAKTILTISLTFVETLIMVIFVFPLSNMPGTMFGERFWYFFLSCWLMFLVSSTYVVIITTFSPTSVVGQVLAPVMCVLVFVSGGYFVPRGNIPVGWKWLHYVSYWTYSFRGAALNFYKGTSYSCDESTLVPPSSVPNFASPFPGGFDSQQVCPITNGDELLERYDMNEDEENKWLYILAMVLYYVVFNFIGAYVTSKLDWSKQYKEQWMMNIQNDTDIMSKRETHLAAESRPEAVEVRFIDLSYDVETKSSSGEPKTLRRILNRVHGIVRPGRLTALMGASGAGKSSLMDVIAGRKTGGKMSGDILFNGRPKDKYFSRWSAYVEQFDSHEPFQTVLEAVTTSARLRLGDVDDAGIEVAVKRTLDLLELEPWKHHRIGHPTTGGLSPELLKKVTIAVEYVTDPHLLFLDEPTTGLDAQSAANIIDLIRKLANHSTVLCTIHQPSQEIVAKFDDVILLQKGGRVVYEGPVQELVPYFEEQGFGHYHQGTNVMDYALEAVERLTSQGDDEKEPKHDEFTQHVSSVDDSVEQKNSTESDDNDIDLESQRVADLSTVFFSSQRGIKMESEIRNKSQKDRPLPKFTSSKAASLFTQFTVLSKRFGYGHTRGVINSAARTVPNLVFGLFSGTLFWQLSQDQDGGFNRFPFVMLGAIFVVFVAQSTIYMIVEAREMYFRETKSMIYSPLAYYLAEMLTDVPLVVFGSMLFSVPSYWLTGFRDDDNGEAFAGYVIMYAIAALLGSAWAALCARAAPNAEFATLIFTVPLITFIAFAGFLLNGDSIPSVWKVFYYYNFFRYPMNYILTGEMDDLPLYCTEDQILYVPSQDPACEGEPTSNENCFHPVCPVQDGNTLLNTFDMDVDDRSIYFLSAVIILVGVRTLGYFALRYINYVKR